MAKSSWDWNAFRLAVIEAGIRGELTADWRAANPDVEPAHVLLERIAEEKAELIRTKQIRKEKPLPPISPDKVPFDIPSSWEYVTLGECVILISGRDLAKNQYQTERSGVPYITGASNFRDGRILINRWTDEPVSISVRGDLLFTCKGTIGAMAISDLPECHIARQIMALRPICGVPVQFYRNLLSLQVEHLLSSAKSLIPGIGRDELLQLKVGWPPLEEQQEIVRILSALDSGESDGPVHPVVARIQKLEQEFRALADEYESQEKWLADLRSALLQEAISGQLTADWRSANPNVEPAHVLLERIAEEKAELIRTKQIRKEKPLPPITPDEVPFDIPSSWEWARTNEITSEVTKGSSPKWQGVSYVEESEDAVLFVTSENVGNRELVWGNVKYVQSRFNELSERSILQPGDVLTNIVGSIGRTAIWERNVQANINQAVCILRLVEKQNGPYLREYLSSPTGIKGLWGKTFDTGRGNLSMGKLKELVVAFPPLAEQQEIVRRLEVQLEKVEALQEELERSKEAAQLLMKSKLSEVFELAMED